MKNRVEFKKHGIQNVHSLNFADSFETVGFDNSMNLARYLEKMQIRVTSLDEYDMEFEIEGIDAPIANALRRIMLAEVPTMAIEKVVLEQNTSVLADEVLCHRLGLVPIIADPELFRYKRFEEE